MGGIVRKWVRATWGGWLLGVPIIVVLALAGEAVGLGGAQALVGAGMGIGVGWRQGRALRGLLGSAAPWFWATAVGLTAPFLATDLATLAGWHSTYSLIGAVAAGGLAAGSWQSRLLSARLPRAGSWIAASAIGWSAAAAAVFWADALLRSASLRGVWGALVYLGAIGGGGLVLGVVTGVWMAAHGSLLPRDTL
jgi:hypothetical protein